MLRASLLVIVVTLGLSACAADTAPDPVETSATTTAATTPTQPTSTELSFGDAETVAWAPTAALAGELSITVERVRAGDFADFAGLAGSGITEANSPFYVDVSIANTGDVDLGGRDVPLYLADSGAVLSPPWSFAAPFKPCASGPLPQTFAGGDEAEVCLVFFASPDATFESITFQPTLETAAVKWTGEVAVQKTKSGGNDKGRKGKRKRR